MVPKQGPTVPWTAGLVQEAAAEEEIAAQVFSINTNENKPMLFFGRFYLMLQVFFDLLDA